MRVLPVLALVVAILAGLTPQTASAKLGLHGTSTPAVSLSDVDVHVKIDGLVARTTLTVTIQNRGNTRTEATLTFDAPAGSTVSAYALNVNGDFVDGVAVEREHARESYNSEMVRRVDPGLVELVGGSTFCARVFPIEVNSWRTYRFAYVSELTLSGGKAIYTAPLNWTEVVKSASVYIDVAGASTRPAMVGDLFKGLQFHQDEGRFIGQRKYDNVPFNGNLMLAIPAPTTGGVAVGKGPAITAPDVPPPAGPGYYFTLTDFPGQRARMAPADSQPTLHHVGILWDAGIQHDRSDLPRKIGLVKKILGEIRDVDVELRLFGETVEKAVTFPIRGGDTSAIEKALAAVSYDGATRLENLSFPRHLRDGADFDYWILCSQGISPIGSGGQTPETPVYGICAGEPAARDFLTTFCIGSGGALLDLDRMNDQKALDVLEGGEEVLAAIEFNPAEVADVSPGAPRPLGEVVRLAGRLLAPQATVTLRYRDGNRNTTRTFTIRQADATDSSAISRVWFNHRLAEFTADGMPDFEKCLRLGQLFNVVTPATSLLVLETADQYARHNVKPPENMPILRQEYADIMERRRQAQLNEARQRDGDVTLAWDDRMAWYKQVYQYPDNFHYTPPRPANYGGGGGMLFGESRGGGGSLFSSGGGGGGGGGLFNDGGGRRESSGRSRIPDFSDAPDMSLNSKRSNAGGKTNDSPSAAPAPTPAPTPAQPNGPAPIREVVPPPQRAPGAAPGGTTVVDADPWLRQASYIEAMRRVPRKQAYAVFLKQRAEFGSSVAFYLDCGDYLARYCDRAQAVRAFSDALMLRPDDPAVARMVAGRLQMLGERQRALDVYQRAVNLGSEDPQNYRDLALALADSGDRAAEINTTASRPVALDCYRRAMDLLRTVATRTWTRSPGIQVVALTECGAILNKARAVDPDVRSPIDLSIGGLLDMDLRIVLTWDSRVHLSLSVVEPSGEVAQAHGGVTTIGGRVFTDCKGGFGPQEYCLRRLMPGRYVIKINNLPSPDALRHTMVQATVITDFGRPTEKRQVFSVLVNNAKDGVEVGAVTLGTGDHR